MTCPKCNHEGWKKASLVHSEGLHATQSNTTGYGIGIGTGGIGIGVGRAHNAGYQQSILSKHAAPPKAPFHWSDAIVPLGILFLIFISAVICFFLYFSPLNFAGIFWSAVVAIASLFGFRAIIRHSRKGNAEYLCSSRKWESQRMCTRCGHFY